MVTQSKGVFLVVRKNTKKNQHAIVISHKVVPKAVQRNTIKRRIRHILQHKNVPPQVVIVKKNVFTFSHDELVQILDTELTTNQKPNNV